MLWLLLSVAVVAASPLGRAIAERISGRMPDADPDRDSLHWMEQRIEERILELEDRLDMAERLLERPPGIGPTALGDRTEA